ncbi:hypothetical protein JGU71_06860 [Antrihabitans sp. YC3-6]|uniref:Uncharacterized protein n=1 Tax=Antrihabitans stalagmiti TaxID=2799499 RepID=A0A934NNT4_9NOCA|nr:hypothetical protein [Antrihabitans stalagmiti]MBJ8338599.1 hypothetical protein [Antrihabitans stalagmiti]
MSMEMLGGQNSMVMDAGNYLREITVARVGDEWDSASSLFVAGDRTKNMTRILYPTPTTWRVYPGDLMDKYHEDKKLQEFFEGLRNLMQSDSGRLWYGCILSVIREPYDVVVRFEYDPARAAALFAFDVNAIDSFTDRAERLRVQR